MRSSTSSLFVASLVPLVLLVSFLPSTESTVPLVVGTATILTAQQVSALVAVGLLIKIGSIVKGGVLAATSRRGRREAEEASAFSIETLVEMEEEECYKRVICAAATGE